MKLKQRSIRSIEVEIEVKLEKFESEYIEAEEFEILWWAELSPACSRLQRNQETNIAAVKFSSAKTSKDAFNL